MLKTELDATFDVFPVEQNNRLLISGLKSAKTLD